MTAVTRSEILTLKKRLFVMLLRCFPKNPMNHPCRSLASSAFGLFWYVFLGLIVFIMLTPMQQSAFDTVTNTNFALSRTTAADGLHMYKQGKYGKQWLPKLLGWMTKNQKERMDDMYVYLPKVPFR